jgi:hypothetical protein
MKRLDNNKENYASNDSSTEDAKHLGPHLDRRLAWRKHMFTQRKQLGMMLTHL